MIVQIARDGSGKLGTGHMCIAQRPVASQDTDVMNPEFLQVPTVATGPF